VKALCTRCGKRRAKRHCPALDAPICSRCCGEDRLVRIDCPPTCPHLRQDESFQKDKQRPRYREAWTAINADLRDRETDLRIVLVLEALVLRASQQFRAVADAEIEIALDDLHRSLSPLELVSSAPGPLSRRLLEEVEPLVQEAGSDRVRELVDRIRRVLKRVRDPEAPRAFLHGLSAYADPALLPEPPAPRSSGLIITPDDLRHG
jgi:hypothetical protein